MIIKPKKGWQLINLRELREYQDLFYFLVIRNIKVRYKQTVLGGLWAIIQPFFMMIVFTVVFGQLAKLPSDGIPYPIFSYSALVAWTYFAGTVTNSSNSIVQDGGLVSKVYFPRLIIPLTPALSGLLDFVIAFVILIGMMLYYQIYPTIWTLTLPLLVILMMLTASGVGMLLTALGTRYHDIRYIVPFLVQFWMFASPVVYPVSMIPEKYQLIYAINPMVGVIQGFRSALLGTGSFPTQMILISTLVSIALFIMGAFYFKRLEHHFVDLI